MSHAKTADSIEMPFGGLTHVGPRKHVVDVVKVGRIHSPLQGVTSRRRGLSSKFVDQLLMLLRIIDTSIINVMQ